MSDDGALKAEIKRAWNAAFEAGDMDRVQALANAAKELQTSEEALEANKKRVSSLLHPDGALAVPTEPMDDSRGQNGESRAKKENRNGYPLFRVEGRVLMREALRSDRATVYVQRMPRDKFDQVIESLRELLSKRERFHVPEVVEKADVPSYHVYMTLGVLQEAGYIDVVKRGQYRFLKRDEDSWGSTVWNMIRRESAD